MPRGAKPKPPGQSVTRHKPVHEWRDAPAAGWQHGDVPEPPEGLMPESLEAWGLWFGAWWAAWWTVEDVPALREMVKSFDQVVRGKVELNKILTTLDRWGITPKGRTDMRWAPPKVEEPAKVQTGEVRRLRVADTA